MKKKLTMVVSLLLVMALSIGGTLAYLTDKTDTVVNTFTIGQITLSLAEAGATDENKDGTFEKSYKIIPGTEAAKEPKLTVAAGSEECYVYAMVDNTLNLKDGTAVATLDIDTAKWNKVAEKDTATLYKFKTTVNVLDASDDWTESVFTKVTYSDAITEENIGQLAGKTITIKGFAHQTAGVEPADADAAAKSHFGF